MSKQSKTKLKNEKIKRKYLHWIENAQGFSEKTITAIEKALWKYEEFTQDEDYVSFSSRRAEQFKKFLQRMDEILEGTDKRSDSRDSAS